MSEHQTLGSGAGSARPAAQRGPGRPRNTETQERVLRATARLISGAEDLAQVTMTAITQASGVSRAAIYRRWSTREQVLAAALNFERTTPSVPDTGDLVADIMGSFGSMGDLDSEHAKATMSMARKRIILGLQDPALMRENWVAHVSHRRDGQRERFRVAIERGELPAAADVEALTDLVSGVFYYQIMVRGEPLEGPALERVRKALELALRP